MSSERDHHPNAMQAKRDDQPSFQPPDMLRPPARDLLPQPRHSPSQSPGRSPDSRLGQNGGGAHLPPLPPLHARMGSTMGQPLQSFPSFLHQQHLLQQSPPQPPLPWETHAPTQQAMPPLALPMQAHLEVVRPMPSVSPPSASEISEPPPARSSSIRMHFSTSTESMDDEATTLSSDHSHAAHARELDGARSDTPLSSSQDSGSESRSDSDEDDDSQEERFDADAPGELLRARFDARFGDSAENISARHSADMLANDMQIARRRAPPPPASSSSASMRKAASAADFKTFHSSGNRSVANLGVLTNFYPTHDGGSSNGSSNSISAIGALRPSTSHAVLHTTSGSNIALASAVRRPASSGSVPPLVPQFSLGEFVKYDGQPRKRRAEIAMVTDKLRDMQYEIGRLSRKIREAEEDTEQWTLRYSRRIVILSNLSLGIWIFFLQFLAGLRARSVTDSALTRLFIPRNILALAATSAAKTVGSSAIPLSGVLISAFLTGFQSSLLFLLSAGLQIRTQSWKRNAGFLLSTGYSLYLVLLRRKEFRPHAAIYANILANLVHTSARYYFLHGLLAFNDMRIL